MSLPEDGREGQVAGSLYIKFRNFGVIPAILGVGNKEQRRGVHRIEQETPKRHVYERRGYLRRTLEAPGRSFGIVTVCVQRQAERLLGSYAMFQEAGTLNGSRAKS